MFRDVNANISVDGIIEFMDCVCVCMDDAANNPTTKLINFHAIKADVCTIQMLANRNWDLYEEFCRILSPSKCGF